MLILSRKLNERIVIGEGATAAIVQVVEISRGKIRLGVIAAKEVNVVREELLGSDDDRLGMLRGLQL